MESLRRIERSEYRYIGRPNEPELGNPAQVLQQILMEPQFQKEADLVIARFTDALLTLRERDGISLLCFLHLEGRPVGAISMMHRLVAEVGLPASVWSRRQGSFLQGHKPHDGEKVALVHDLCVSGATLIEATRALQEHKLYAVAAVVFFNQSLPLLVDRDVKLPIVEVARSADLTVTGVTSTTGVASKQWIHPPGSATPVGGGVGGSTLPSPSLIPEEGMESTTEEFIMHGDPPTGKQFLRQVFVRTVPILFGTILAVITIGSNLPTQTAGILLFAQVLLYLVGLYCWFRVGQ